MTCAGTVGVLHTRGGDNYYHFLTDVLPRLELLRRAGIEPESYLVNRTTRFQRDLLDHLGITAGRCLGSEKYPHLRAERLVVPSLPDDDLRTPPWIVPWLRDRFLPADVAPPHRRLYVGRGNQKHTRRVDNEAEVLAALEPLGFESIDPGQMSPAEQVRAFAEAECVVGVHGAGLTNLAFCPPGVGVVELFAPDYVNECFWALATTVEGLRYRYLVGDGLPAERRVSRANRGVASDVRVEPRQVAPPPRRPALTAPPGSSAGQWLQRRMQFVARPSDPTASFTLDRSYPFELLPRSRAEWGCQQVPAQGTCVTKTRIVVHDYSGHPGQAQLSRALAGRGYEVVHQHCPSYATGKGSLELEAGDPASLRFEAVPMNGAFAKYSPVTRMRQELAYGRRVARLIAAEDPGVAIISNVPLFAHSVLARALWRRGIPMVFWHQDIYAEGIDKAARMKLPLVGGASGRVADRIERKIARRSEAVVAISPTFLDRLAAWGVSHKATVVPNWAPIDELPVRRRRTPGASAWA